MTTITTSDGIRLDVRTTGAACHWYSFTNSQAMREAGSRRSGISPATFDARRIARAAIRRPTFRRREKPTIKCALLKISPMWCAPSPTVRRTSSAWRARHWLARRDAQGGRAAAHRCGHHDDPRHARPGRGAVVRRPVGRDARRLDGAGRQAGRRLLAARRRDREFPRWAISWRRMSMTAGRNVSSGASL